MKILVLGGTRFFGTHLVQSLLKEGHEVTVATRGNQDFVFKNQVRFEKADRHNLEDLKRLASLGPYDLIYDQICMSAKNAHDACVAFNGKCKKYIFTSTGSVYDPAKDLDLFESFFEPAQYTVNLKDTEPYDYQEAKRQAEAVFSQLAPFPVTIVRLPIVLGTDDYSKRLKFHVFAVKNQTEIYFPNLETRMGFIQSHEAGHFLNFIGKHSFTGPVNAVSSGYISLRELMKIIEEKCGKKTVYAAAADDKNHSPYGFETDFMMPNKNALSLGYQFEKLMDYLPKLVEFYLR